MAEYPAEIEREPLFPGSDFLKGATDMPVVRQLTLTIALAASVAIAIFAAMWMQKPEYRPLGISAEPQETAEIVRALEARQIDFTLDQRSGMIMVAADRIYDARMAMAEEDILVGSQKGYELLDEEQGFGVSQFREHNNHRRSVEGELRRSIMKINAVVDARVILATPKTTTFLRDRRKPSASVHVVLRSGRQLTPDKVRGIMNLVAAGVPELQAEDVVVVDQSGTLLSRGANDASVMRSERELGLVRTIETSLYDKVSNILTPWVGQDRFTAEVNAELDFTRVEATEERYSPEAAVRSEQSSEEQQVGRDGTIGGVPGTLTNQPPGLAEGEVAEDNVVERQTRTTATRNYELDRTVSYTQNPVGRLERISVAVVVDYNTIVDAETGEETQEPWTQEDLDTLANAVRSAVGFREERGDLVSVVSRPFRRADVAEAASTPIWEQTWFMDIIKQVLGGLAIIVVIFGLLRPLYRNLSQAGELVREKQSLAIADMAQMREAAMQEVVPGLPTPISLDPDDSQAAKMETVRNLIADDPERVAQVIKKWVREDEP